LGRLCCVEKRKDKGLARVLSGVLPLHCHLPRLGCLVLRHQRQAYQRMRDVVVSSQVFWEAWLSAVCSVFVQSFVWNVTKVWRRQTTGAWHKVPSKRDNTPTWLYNSSDGNCETLLLSRLMSSRKVGFFGEELTMSLSWHACRFVLEVLSKHALACFAWRSLQEMIVAILHQEISLCYCGHSRCRRHSGVR
jgi:hypothetical protein